MGRCILSKRQREGKLMIDIKLALLTSILLGTGIVILSLALGLSLQTVAIATGVAGFISGIVSSRLAR